MLLVLSKLTCHYLNQTVQKLIEIIKTPREVSMVVSSLKPGVVTLIKDSNGNHVVQRCLQRLSSANNQVI